MDLGGLAVAPGFIDAHSHSDLAPFGGSPFEPKIRQGVTTEVVGQDGMTMAPIDTNPGEEWARYLRAVIGHVKDGMEMAREYGLPPDVRQFIESHHGTTLVEYFYHAAMQKSAGSHGPGPSEFEFRYPGPKPQTKEAAILLLCDSIEGAARSLDEPTPVRLDQVVHNMANKRLMDGQFDECNLTLKELASIEAAITKTLCAIYHGRIKYPAGDQPRAESSAQASPLQRPSAAS